MLPSAEIIYAPAWLTKVVTNLCLNRMTSARARRETYIGPWLPEPVLTADGALGPLDTVEQRESVSLALLMLMEQLTPTERAVVVLREAFSYSHRQIAEFLDVSEANSRQLHSRARHRLGDAHPRFEPDRAQWRRLVEHFLAAARGGDAAQLRELLAADVTSTADGGGKVGAARRVVVGPDRVARYLAGALSRLAPTGLEVFLAEVNAGPAVLGLDGGELRGVLVLEIVAGRVRTALGALLLFAVPHLIFHATHSGHVTTTAAVAELVALTIAAVLPATLLTLTFHPE